MLTEKRRQQLDRIVNEMAQNDEDDSTIQFVVDDFKMKYANEAIETPKPQGVTGAAGVGLGAAKGAGSTGFNLATLGERALANTAGRVANLVTGNGFTATPRNTQFESQVKTALTPQGTAEKIGYTAEQVGEFFIPGGAAGKAGKAAELAGLSRKATIGAKALTEGANVAGLTTLQGGNAGDVAGNLAGVGVAGAAAKGLSVAAEKLAPRIVNSFIKPLSKDFEFGKNPGAAIVNEKITANSFDDLVKKVSVRRMEVGDQIGQVLNNKLVGVQSVDVSKAFAPLDEAIEKATKHGDQTLVNALEEFRHTVSNNFTRVNDTTTGRSTLIPAPRKLTMPPKEAFEIKKQIGDSVRWREGIDNEVNKVKTQVYRALTGQIDNAVESARKTNSKIPSIKPLNSRYANLTTAETAAKYRRTANDRKDLVSLGGKLIGGGVGVYGGYQNIQQGDVAGLAGDLALGLGIAGAGKALASTAVKTRVAQAVRKLSPDQNKLLKKAIPLIRNVFLGQNSGK